MSDKDIQKAPKATANLSDKDLMGLLDAYIAKGAQELSLERLMWKPAECGKFPVIGHIVSINDMPEADRAENPDWRAFVVQLTQPTYGLDRDKKKKRLEAGAEVIVPANWQLASNLARFALDPANVYELGIQVTGQLDVGGGKKMWQFRVIVIGLKPREGSDLLALREANATAQAKHEAKQLAENNGAAATG